MKISFLHVALAASALANVATAGMLAWFMLVKPDVMVAGTVYVDTSNGALRVESGRWDDPVRVEVIGGKVSITP